MKWFQSFFWIVLLFDMILLAYAAVYFHVDNMTLSEGAIDAFNQNWVLVDADGNREIISLPYSGTSDAGDTVVIENTIPSDCFGKCLEFLSADKQLRVFMDDELVYEFGMHDKRAFGHTPGSVVNYIDIPPNLETGTIRIEMTSPYDDYAAQISELTIGERDVLILTLLKNKMFSIAGCLILLIAGIILMLLSFMQRLSKQPTHGAQYLGAYCMISFLYYLIETKILSIFYGNQTVYSILVFLCLMLMPFLVILYFEDYFKNRFNKRWKVLLVLVSANIVVQLVLQLWNVCDFMEMAACSHGMIFLTIVVAIYTLIGICRQDRDIESVLELIAMSVMGLGGIIDMIRMYTVRIGDMGKYSRYATTVFGGIGLFVHIRRVSRSYSHKVEENASLLQREVEYMEQQNERLQQAKEEAEAAKQEAVKANESKGRFLANMSHEIRTPMNAVLGMDAMILRECKDNKIKEYALDIQTAGQSLLSLINDILDFSKIESGKLEIIPVEYGLSSVIHDVMNMISQKAHDKGLAVDVSVDSDLPSRLYGDEVRIRQILINLLNNAVKYTNEGSVSLAVRGRILDDFVELDVSVKDTGIGIKAEDIERLFVEFERIEEQRNRNVEGTGLGMNITTRLLELMGGELDVKSVYGQGSCFHFTLQQKLVDRQPIGNLEERIRQQAVEYSYTASFTASNARVLIVDDNAMNRRVFRNIIKQTKVVVDEADSGAVCLSRIQQTHYDLIFLDHMMPQMDGVETLHLMKADKTHLCQHTKVVALTANAISGVKERYLEEGFDDYLSKPIIPEKLETMLWQMLPDDLVDRGTVGEAGSESTDEERVETVRLSSVAGGHLPEVEGLDWDYARLHLPNEEMILDSVREFYQAIEPEADYLENCYTAICAAMEDTKGLEETKENPLYQYQIKVHSMKSTAALIGAVALYGVASMLEAAARGGKLETIRNATPVFLEQWRSYKERLNQALHAPKQTRAALEDYAILLAYLELIRHAMDDLDVDVLDDTMEELRQYDYPDAIKESMRQLDAAVTKLDAEQVRELVPSIMWQINMMEENAW